MHRPSLAAAALVLLLLAGCAQQANLPSTSQTSTAQANLPATLASPLPREPVLVGDAGGGAEPNIAAAPDGTLYISSPLAVWRSDDNGTTWKATASKNLEGGGDGDLAVGPTGTVYWLGLFGNSNRKVPFQTSHDKGESWSDAVDLSEGSGQDREWIDASADGHLYATWRGTGGLEFRASADNGTTWGKKVIAGPDGDEGPVTHDPVSGALYIASVDQAATAGLEKPVVHVYTSMDQGQHWTEATVATMPRTSPVEPNAYASDFPVVSVDAAGTAYLVYSADASAFPAGQAPPEEAALYGIYLSASHDQGKTWSAPTMVSPTGHDARFPWIAAGAPGRIAIVWYQSARAIPGEMLPDEWTPMLWESITAGNGTTQVVALSSTPTHLGALCTSGTGCLAADRSLLDFFEVAIGPTGQPVVAFASSTLGTGVGLAVKPTQVFYGTVQGTRLA